MMTERITARVDKRDLALIIAGLTGGLALLGYLLFTQHTPRVEIKYPWTLVHSTDFPLKVKEWKPTIVEGFSSEESCYRAFARIQQKQREPAEEIKYGHCENEGWKQR